MRARVIRLTYLLKHENIDYGSFSNDLSIQVAAGIACEEKIKSLKRRCISILDQYIYLAENNKETTFIDDKFDEIMTFVQASKANKVKEEATASAVQGA